MVVAQRREALTSVVICLGMIGVALCVAADVTKHSPEEAWQACLGQRPKSPGPRLSQAAQIAFLLAAVIGVTRSKRAYRVMLTSRFFMPWKRDRGFRLKIIIPFAATGICLYYARQYLEWTAERDRLNQICTAGRQGKAGMEKGHIDMSEWEYSQGGCLGFTGSVCASAFFIMHDIRKRTREKARRRWYSSNYYDEDVDTGDESDDAQVEMSDMRDSRESSTVYRRH